MDGLDTSNNGVVVMAATNRCVLYTYEVAHVCAKFTYVDIQSMFDECFRFISYSFPPLNCMLSRQFIYRYCYNFVGVFTLFLFMLFRYELLDPALLRSGRFDRIIQCPLPDRDGRLEILKVHTRKLALTTGVDLDR